MIRRCIFLLVLGGCSTDPRDIGREPRFTAMGAGLVATTELPNTFDNRTGAPAAARSLWSERGGELFKDARATGVGDLITVVIAINDSASLGNSTNRDRSSLFTNNFDASSQSPALQFKANGALNAAADSSTKGSGTIGRSEKIQLSVAAVVTDVLANGNLVVSGSQEVRVNFELRELTVAGIVRPRDVSRDNTINYDKIAEARISYGGRGRLSEIQQPGLVHQILDLIKPF